VHILHRYSLGDVFVAKSWTTDDRWPLFGFVGVSSHSSVLISLPNPDDWVWLLFFFFSAPMVDGLVLPRARPLSVIIDIDVDGFVVRDRIGASAGRDVFPILKLNAGNNWYDDIRRYLIITYDEWLKLFIVLFSGYV
jgi:hypothetical protein